MSHVCNARATGTQCALMAMLMFAGSAFSATLTLTEAKLVDHIKGGWIAENCGLRIGLPYENWGPDQNRTLGTITSTNIPLCGDDDIYGELPFLATMSTKKGGANGIFTATMQDYGDAWKATTFPLWFGNNDARNALKDGYNPPYSGGWPLNGWSPNGNAEAIDYQIECQWIGLSTPCLPAYCFKIDSLCGHVIGYANGIYAGTFFDIAISIAPLYSDIHTIVKQANSALPPQCDIRKNNDSLISYHDKNPTKTYWDAMNWAMGMNGQSAHCIADFTQGSRTNEIVVAIALLWGDGDMMNTLTDCVRMGQDADCNCADACTIVGCMLGYANLPQAWRTAYEAAPNCTFSNSTGVSGWTFSRVLDSTLAIAKKGILQAGGSYANGVYTIPVQEIPSPQWFEKSGSIPQFIGHTHTAQRSIVSADEFLGLSTTTLKGSSPSISITALGVHAVRLLSPSGSVIRSLTGAGPRTYAFKAGELVPGIYLLSASVNGANLVRQLIIQ